MTTPDAVVEAFAMVIFGVVPPLDEIGRDPVTLVTVPFPLPVPAPIAVLKLAASKALTVLSALNLGKVMAEGLVIVNKLEPKVFAPKAVLAAEADVAPVPPLAMGNAVPE